MERKIVCVHQQQGFSKKLLRVLFLDTGDTDSYTDTEAVLVFPIIKYVDFMSLHSVHDGKND
jgi:hypothetical protein